MLTKEQVTKHIVDVLNGIDMEEDTSATMFYQDVECKEPAGNTAIVNIRGQQFVMHIRDVAK